jgi:hypothetical protein
MHPMDRGLEHHLCDLLKNPKNYVKNKKIGNGNNGK